VSRAYTRPSAGICWLLLGESATWATEKPLEGVVITAEKRPEDVQKVPLAVTVVSGRELQRIDALGIADLAAVVPSITFNTGRELRDSSIRIRGVGTDVILPGIEPSVSTVIDGVVLAQQGSFFNDLGDLERVEVLRGPQGTLFGMNSSAGAISVVTKNPEFQRLEIESNALVTADGEYRLHGAVSAPLSSSVAFRVGLFQRHSDGAVKDVNTAITYNGVEDRGLRGKLQWRLTDSVDLLLSADGQRFRSNCCALPVRVASKNPIVPALGISTGPLNSLVSLGGSNVFADQENYGGSLTANAVMSGYTVTYIGATRKWTSAGDFDVDSSPAHIVTSNLNTTDARQTSHEVRLVSPILPGIDYVLGLFYLATNTKQTLDRRGTRINLITAVNPDGTVAAPPDSGLALIANSTIKTQNASAYGQFDMRPVDRMTITAGARFISQKQHLTFSRPLPSPFYGVGALGPVNGEYSDHATIMKAALTWAWTADVGTYASFSTGYKAQGIPAAPTISQAMLASFPLKAESSRLWEIGLRSQFFARQLTLNLTGFLTKFADYQQQAFDSTLGTFVITNAGNVHTNGVELELAWSASERLSIATAATYLNAGYDFSGPCYLGETPALGCKGGQQDLSKGEFVNAPKLKYTMLARYTQPLSERSAVYGQANVRWQSAVQFAYDQDPRFVQRTYGITNFKTGALLSAGRYDVSIFVNNAFNTHYVSNVIAQGAAGGGAVVNAIPRDFERYFGAELNFRL